MQLSKQKIQFILASFIFVFLALAAFSTTALAEVNADAVCANLNTDKIAQCKTYVKNYNKCDIADTACLNAADVKYSVAICGTVNTSDPTWLTCSRGDGVNKIGALNSPNNSEDPQLSDTSVISGAPTEEEVYKYGENCAGKTADECFAINPIVKWLNVLINFFAGIVGIGAVVMIIVAGIQYTASRDNPQSIQAAKEKITSVVIGLVAFGLLYAFVQWLVPGGVF